MDKEISIEEESPVQDTSEETAQLPINFLSVGKIEKDDVKIYIHQSVISALEEYACSDTKNELGSILLGAYSTALGQTAVIVSEYIEAKYTDTSASTLTFTHETWDYVHKEQAEKHPDLRIVGWQHTHPGYGIFLSNYDMFIQENFFNLPFQIAYVIDPVQNIRGFFCWKNGRVEKLKGYYIYDEPGMIIVPPSEGKDEPGPETAAASADRPGKDNGLLGLVLALAVVCAALIAAVVMLWLRLSESNAQIQKLFSLQHTTQEQLQAYSINQNTFNASVADRILLIGSELEDNELAIEEAQSRLDGLENDGEDNAITFRKITVQEEETLLSLCERLGLPYEESAKLILGINGLSDESEIAAGQSLLVPLS